MVNISRTETGSKPAPGKLVLIQAFVNTFDLDSQRDALASPALLTHWLKRHDLLSGDTVATHADLQRTIAFREGLRALLLTNNGVALEPETVQVLNAVAAPSKLTVYFDSDGLTMLKPDGNDPTGAIASLLATVNDAMVAGTWARLKACRNPECHWVFYDHSKNRSGTWCTMAVCGSRLKMRAYRDRQQRGG
jgi:predicted RNA-binding Zn ribbon-like protein